MRNQTQDDLVRQDQGFTAKEVNRQVTLPGIDKLHTKSIPEIAEVLANVLRMEQGIVKFTWTVGTGIELTLASPE